MRTFIIRARKGATRWEKIRSSVGSEQHFEVILHSIMNAFFIANDFRDDVVVYIVLDSAEDFPRTIKLSSHEGLSLSGFHEEAIILLIENTLKASIGLQKDEIRDIVPGVQIHGFGFERLVGNLLQSNTIYLLDPKGSDIRSINLDSNSVFILSDHLALPKNNIKSLKNKGVKTVSLGKKMLFASQCIVLLHYEMDRVR